MFENLASLYVLVGVSFITSFMTAAIGVGGGIGLLAVMPQFLPISAVIPVHGLIQMVSNASRFAFDYKSAKVDILPKYIIGCLVGAFIGYFFIGKFPEKYLSLVLGFFILVITWTKIVSYLGFIFKNFAIVGFVQTFLSLFVAVTGLISQPILMKMDIKKDEVIVTHAMQMSVLHGLKVAAFVIAGFAFMDYAGLIIIMIIASTVGSYFGGFLRDRISQRVGAMLLKAGVTFFGLKMILDHFTQSV
ncbi:TSUP family transporter [Pseudomonas sp. 10S4]|uniref:TSUP family transporter n=1 Tax=Pseudomonas sp. 10S4 TaxID=3048583 RepID=UPI002AC8EEEF|nr:MULTISPECIES: TSUP family transporter [unclassified Pseudomonas]MEB0226999.1 TSUP family transporter [Pseudomonas sp. 5S1]MEB0296411.1 TSUP family transporter [Pseudomonas sp. 10S4]WPX20222.1 TSUP family transporter [Pseudomonas sp. 10S4]